MLFDNSKFKNYKNKTFRKKSFIKSPTFIVMSTISICIVFYLYYSILIYKTRENIFTVESGDSLISISRNLEDRNIINSATIFKIVFVILNGKDKSIAFGDYNFFAKDFNMIKIIQKLGGGKADQSGVAILVPEGFTNYEIAKRVENIYGIDFDIFYPYIKSYQGKLFPDTYFFERGVTKEKIVKKMLAEFEERVGQMSQDDIVLASIIEGEARDYIDMQIISGILQKRLKIKMPLQVDVALETYKVLGLPKNPINNPGLNAINSVGNPIKTEYLYYITGNDGKMYYAKTFEEHKRNIAKYLKI